MVNLVHCGSRYKAANEVHKLRRNMNRSRQRNMAVRTVDRAVTVKVPAPEVGMIFHVATLDREALSRSDSVAAQNGRKAWRLDAETRGGFGRSLMLDTGDCVVRLQKVPQRLDSVAVGLTENHNNGVLVGNTAVSHQQANPIGSDWRSHVKCRLVDRLSESPLRFGVVRKNHHAPLPFLGTKTIGVLQILCSHSPSLPRAVISTKYFSDRAHPHAVFLGNYAQFFACLVRSNHSPFCIFAIDRGHDSLAGWT